MNRDPMTMFHAALAKEGTTHIKLLGDSITHGVGGTGFAQTGAPIAAKFARNPDGYCWAKRFKDALESRFDCTVTNNGCTGTRIEFILNHFDELVDEHDDFILCTIGTNNRVRAFSAGEKPTKEAYMGEFYANILRLWEKFKAVGKEDKVVFVANIPVCAFKDEEVGEGVWRLFRMGELNDMYRRASLECGYAMLSLYEKMTDYCAKNGVELGELLVDGVHHNDRGYDVMYELICDALGLAE
ncbi:MAG: SGNH/GDSL hydrolase family protein [Oscillospiraceae bacterium]|nr:SGNH/GDSL hydrolase family protein [Oscillospiraceae bacterium]